MVDTPLQHVHSLHQVYRFLQWEMNHEELKEFRSTCTGIVESLIKPQLEENIGTSWNTIFLRDGNVDLYSSVQARAKIFDQYPEYEDFDTARGDDWSTYATELDNGYASDIARLHLLICDASGIYQSRIAWWGNISQKPTFEKVKTMIQSLSQWYDVAPVTAKSTTSSNDVQDIQTMDSAALKSHRDTFRQIWKDSDQYSIHTLSVLEMQSRIKTMDTIQSAIEVILNTIETFPQIKTSDQQFMYNELHQTRDSIEWYKKIIMNQMKKLHETSNGILLSVRKNLRDLDTKNQLPKLDDILVAWLYDDIDSFDQKTISWIQELIGSDITSVWTNYDTKVLIEHINTVLNKNIVLIDQEQRTIEEKLNTMEWPNQVKTQERKETYTALHNRLKDIEDEKKWLIQQMQEVQKTAWFSQAPKKQDTSIWWMSGVPLASPVADITTTLTDLSITPEKIETPLVIDGIMDTNEEIDIEILRLLKEKGFDELCFFAAKIFAKQKDDNRIFNDAELHRKKSLTYEQVDTILGDLVTLEIIWPAQEGSNFREIFFSDEDTLRTHLLNKLKAIKIGDSEHVVIFDNDNAIDEVVKTDDEIVFDLDPSAIELTEEQIQAILTKKWYDDDLYAFSRNQGGTYHLSWLKKWDKNTYAALPSWFVEKLRQLDHIWAISWLEIGSYNESIGVYEDISFIIEHDFISEIVKEKAQNNTLPLYSKPDMLVSPKIPETRELTDEQIQQYLTDKWYSKDIWERIKKMNTTFEKKYVGQKEHLSYKNFTSLSNIKQLEHLWLIGNVEYRQYGNEPGKYDISFTILDKDIVTLCKNNIIAGTIKPWTRIFSIDQNTILSDAEIQAALTSKWYDRDLWNFVAWLDIRHSTLDIKQWHDRTVNILDEASYSKLRQLERIWVIQDLSWNDTGGGVFNNIKYTLAVDSMQESIRDMIDKDIIPLRIDFWWPITPSWKPIEHPTNSEAIRTDIDKVDSRTDAEIQAYLTDKWYRDDFWEFAKEETRENIEKSWFKNSKIWNTFDNEADYDNHFALEHIRAIKDVAQLSDDQKNWRTYWLSYTLLQPDPEKHIRDLIRSGKFPDRTGEPIKEESMVEKAKAKLNEWRNKVKEFFESEETEAIPNTPAQQTQQTQQTPETPQQKKRYEAVWSWIKTAAKWLWKSVSAAVAGLAVPAASGAGVVLGSQVFAPWLAVTGYTIIWWALVLPALGYGLYRDSKQWFATTKKIWSWLKASTRWLAQKVWNAPLWK
jgi:hypothetical protein